MTKRRTPDAPPLELPETHIRDLVPDAANRRNHTARNTGMLVEALHKVGAARSIVIDESNEILAGNATVEAAAEAGITKLQIVEADGDTIIAVRRRNLTPEQKRYLAIADNRTAELAEWNPEQLHADRANGLDLAPFFTEDELRFMLKSFNPPDVFASVDETVDTEHRCPKCGYEWSGASKPKTAVAQQVTDDRAPSE